MKFKFLIISVFIILVVSCKNSISYKPTDYICNTDVIYKNKVVLSLQIHCKFFNSKKLNYLQIVKPPLFSSNHEEMQKYIKIENIINKKLENKKIFVLFDNKTNEISDEIDKANKEFFNIIINDQKEIQDNKLVSIVFLSTWSNFYNFSIANISLKDLEGIHFNKQGIILTATTKNKNTEFNTQVENNVIISRETVYELYGDTKFHLTLSQ